MLEVPIQNRWGEVISSFLISKEAEVKYFGEFRRKD